MSGFRDDREALRAKLEATERALDEAQRRQRELERAVAQGRDPPTRGGLAPAVAVLGICLAAGLALWMGAGSTEAPDALSRIEASRSEARDRATEPRTTSHERDVSPIERPRQAADPFEASGTGAGTDLDRRFGERLSIEPTWSARVRASSGEPPVGTPCELRVDSGIGPTPSVTTVECGEGVLFSGVIVDDVYEEGPCRLRAGTSVALRCQAREASIDTEEGTARLSDRQGDPVELEILALTGA